MVPIASDYVIFCFLASLGVLQIAASYSQLRGLLFFQSAFRSISLGLTLIVVGFVWFFGPGPRLVPDTAGGLDGNWQALFFSLSAGAAVIMMLVLSSIINHRRLAAHPSNWGLEALRETTYLHIIQQRLKDLWKKSQKPTSHSISGSTPG